MLGHATPELERRLSIPVAGGHRLEGDLHLPVDARGLVLFAHGSGSSRKSARNGAVARALHARSLGSVLFDLLTTSEALEDELEPSLRFDIPLLSRRLGEVTDWSERQSFAKGLALGYFGASTGAAAALIAAAARPGSVRAIVSRGGRPDLAHDALDHVYAPTLLIVGSKDPTVLALNEAALRRLPGPARLAIVHGASHLFQEPGALERVATLAGDWLVQHLCMPR